MLFRCGKLMAIIFSQFSLIWCAFLPIVLRGGTVGLQMDSFSFSSSSIPLILGAEMTFVDSEGEGDCGWGVVGILLYCRLLVLHGQCAIVIFDILNAPCHCAWQHTDPNYHENNLKLWF